MYKKSNCCIYTLVFYTNLLLKQGKDLEDAFRVADKDKSGRISLEEWIEVLKASGQDVER